MLPMNMISYTTCLSLCEYRHLFYTCTQCLRYFNANLALLIDYENNLTVFTFVCSAKLRCQKWVRFRIYV